MIEILTNMITYRLMVKHKDAPIDVIDYIGCRTEKLGYSVSTG